jgi:hypothetical protein
MQTKHNITIWSRALTGTLVTFASVSLHVHAQPSIVPNGSFESPTPPPGFPVNTKIDAWQESPQPVWFNPADFGGVTWDQLSGVFPNPPPADPTHIVNLDGNQAAYLFAVPQVALFQDYDSVDWNGGAPTRAFDVTYEVGLEYSLTVGVLGGSGMTEGAGLRLSFYYRDAGNNPVTVAATDIAYSTAAFPTMTQLTDYTVTVPSVQATDPWAGQKMGLEIAATSQGGTYWDVDNARVSAVPEPGSLSLLALGLAALLGRRRSSTDPRREAR